jgi:hypothetical protein
MRSQKMMEHMEENQGIGHGYGGYGHGDRNVFQF